MWRPPQARIKPIGQKARDCSRRPGPASRRATCPCIQKTKYCRLAGLVSGHPDKAARWAAQYHVPEKNIYNYDNFDRVVDNPEIDIIYVVLPNSMHAD